MATGTPPSGLRRLAHAVLVGIGSLGMTLLFFMVLPLLETIRPQEEKDSLLRDASTTNLPPPPPPIEEEKKDEQQDQQPPDLSSDAPPPDLSQLELALNPGLGGDGGDFAININSLMANNAGGIEELFSANVEQKPRPVFQQPPPLSAAMKKRMPGGVTILLTVNENGRVENPVIESSTDPVFEAPALAAIKQWKFEPGKRGGQPARFRIRQPITFK